MESPQTTTASRIGQIVRQERHRQRMSQETLAFVADVSMSSIYRVERGEPTVRLDVMVRILSALGLSLEVQGR
jgi:y4mF family transcriptional regulator